MKKSLVLLLTVVFAISLAACGNNTNNNAGSANTSSPSPSASESAAPSESATPSAEPLSGSVIASGSSALQPLAQAAADKFMADDQYKGVSVQIQGGGSGTGLSQVSDGQVQIGNSDVFAEEKLDADKAKELVDHKVAVIAMAAVAHKDVGVDNLTQQQLVDIFTGKVTNWKDVGGTDAKIVLVNRPSSSGTRATFEKYALGIKTEDLPGSIQEDASGTVKKLVSETPGAIGYLALSYLDESIIALKYEGVEPTTDNVKTNTYPVWAYEHMYTKGEPDAAAKAFLDYMMSPEIQQKDVVENGYIPTSDMKIERDAAGTVTNK
ncbi:phosphate ABC transporter substrate-binding protein [Cohnella lubricantis]|uniref:Phosphate-binding protein n=1 Tax=Cohnella lubricantis TaxID=2163172 RepID=A0A841T340_9BACL|nr:phosphate ABC transporter substrate-binding protein [Cohnella lubricantis]MBB6676003.1 phosphate ABC transporter substrate-binding protein [Cohnella lubricantis]MBP2117984.1 phosphate transport system substrate-binding protein [Cohnella lubricantis]